MRRFLRNFSITQQIVISFALVILIGTILLSLPISQASTSQAQLLDHLFMSVSMVCVTGLSTVPLAETYNLFGQIISMILIQIGGLGLMTLIGFSVLKLKKALTYQDTILLEASVNRASAVDFKQFLTMIFKFTFLIEGSIALLLMIQFIPEQGIPKGIFNSIYLAVSSFCNAGFDPLGRSSLIAYQTNWLVNLTISAGIILGGLGFSVWFDIYMHTIKTFNSRKNRSLREIIYRFWCGLEIHTRAVLIMTSSLISLGTIIPLVIEWSNPLSIGSFSVGNKVLVSFFQAVTMRTAGFSSISYEHVHPASSIIYMVQMFIGGSPGGTAGGLKTTTFLMVVLFFHHQVRKLKHINLLKRTIVNELVERASVIFFAFTLILLSGFFLMVLFEPTKSFQALLFETFSALGTVGVSMNLTAELNRYSQFVIILLMFIGRLGPLAIFLSLPAKPNRVDVRYAKTNLIIG
ncbi:TrkH family potassium uptake protein [Atopobacter phocae]|uniref:TrkH family potassium uptake protein n=1 Tax=Atopobacter phocae TaxID=136492 RepID=UPI0004712E19|nr:potassium transporter TrkG [Atopobacter phocae]